MHKIQAATQSMAQNRMDAAQRQMRAAENRQRLEDEKRKAALEQVCMHMHVCILYVCMIRGRICACLSVGEDEKRKSGCCGTGAYACMCVLWV